MESPQAFPGCANIQNVVLLASGARTETSTGTTPVTGLGFANAIVFQLDVTAAATAAGDTLDVYVQATLDGTNYVDIVHFTQVLGNGGAKRYYSKIVNATALTEFENGAALAAAAVRNIMGDAYRVRYAITDATTDDASFTFSVTANAQG